MVRISKQNERRNKSPRKHARILPEATGSKSDKLPKGYKEHPNALEGTLGAMAFIPKIK